MKWNLPKQTKLVDFKNPNPKQAGDCWRCCIAAVVGVPAEEVPHFMQQAIDSRHGDDWKDCDQLTQEWLFEKGFVLARTTAGYLCFDYAKKGQQVPVIGCGPTPRSQQMHQHHAVVYVGDEMVYDPHPSEAGLTAITDKYLVIPIANRKSQIANPK